MMSLRRVLGRLRPLLWMPLCAILVMGGVPIAALVALHLSRPGPPPPGEVVAAACVWDGRDLVVTGAVRNLGSSGADYRVTPTFWVVGLGIRGVAEATFVHVPAGQERAWRYVHRSIAPRRAGMLIGRCFPSVQTIRRPGDGERDD
jgi:hypothetical protein